MTISTYLLLFFIEVKKKIDKKTKVFIVESKFSPATSVLMSNFYFEKLQDNNIESVLEIVLSPKHENSFLLSDPNLLKFSKVVIINFWYKN